MFQNQGRNNIQQLDNSCIGQRVCVGATKCGILRYFGETKFAAGIYCGVELDEPVGKNNGSVNDICYFTCKEKHGLFVPVSKVQRLRSDYNINRIDYLTPSDMPKNCQEAVINKTFEMPFIRDLSPSEANLQLAKKTSDSNLTFREKYGSNEKNLEHLDGKFDRKFHHSINESKLIDVGDLETCVSLINQNSRINNLPLFQDNQIENECDDSLGILASDILENISLDSKCLSLNSGQVANEQSVKNVIDSSTNIKNGNIFLPENLNFVQEKPHICCDNRNGSNSNNVNTEMGISFNVKFPCLEIVSLSPEEVKFSPPFCETMGQHFGTFLKSSTPKQIVERESEAICSTPVQAKCNNLRKLFTYSDSLDNIFQSDLPEKQFNEELGISTIDRSSYNENGINLCHPDTVSTREVSAPVAPNNLLHLKTEIDLKNLHLEMIPAFTSVVLSTVNETINDKSSHTQQAVNVDGLSNITFMKTSSDTKSECPAANTTFKCENADIMDDIKENKDNVTFKMVDISEQEQILTEQQTCVLPSPKTDYSEFTIPRNLHIRPPLKNTKKQLNSTFSYDSNKLNKTYTDNSRMHQNVSKDEAKPASRAARKSVSLPMQNKFLKQPLIKCSVDLNKTICMPKNGKKDQRYSNNEPAIINCKGTACLNNKIIPQRYGSFSKNIFHKSNVLPSSNLPNKTQKELNETFTSESRDILNAEKQQIFVSNVIKSKHNICANVCRNVSASVEIANVCSIETGCSENRRCCERGDINPPSTNSNIYAKKNLISLKSASNLSHKSLAKNFKLYPTNTTDSAKMSLSKSNGFKTGHQDGEQRLHQNKVIQSTKEQTQMTTQYFTGRCFRKSLGIQEMKNALSKDKENSSKKTMPASTGVSRIPALHKWNLKK